MPRLSSRQPRTLYGVVKRLTDIFLALALLVVALPILFLAYIAILLTTRRSPIYCQVRVGQGGRLFRMYKLRTMRSTERGDGLPATKSPDDPRVTAAGRFLRRTSLDELPQLFNVLRGRMSLVGPRPWLPVEVDEYPQSWRRTLDVPPGLTGLWQVSGRSLLSRRRRTALDRIYLRRRSTIFDIAILLRSLEAVISMRGAW